MMAKSTQSIIPETIVANKIYEIRGQKVMLDSDLAELYNSETKRLNEQVGRNIDRFPPDFMFQLTEEEWRILKSQFATSSWGGRRKLPFVFTEHGVLMLSSVLSSKQAVQVNIQIVRVFTKLRALLSEHSDLKLEIGDIKKQLQNHDKNIELVFSYIDELTEKKAAPRKRIGYKPDEL
ncbi:ORF6N domain-containing protein [Pedobacter sp. KR3-3]|uniref:ORF6N domain-containing protein n=1 Tax=Pedobacter albus TaxID=3113905 RepID=A0ABU7IA01_9SPHI|nr:ORF6N domain-containing protein [Pedobacter sp. KR3-3]MEE1946305.1 ORF6N domain-containing protein [Pedobacter sp. KR3-3]